MRWGCGCGSIGHVTPAFTIVHQFQLALATVLWLRHYYWLRTTIQLGWQYQLLLYSVPASILPAMWATQNVIIPLREMATTVHQTTLSVRVTWISRNRTETEWLAYRLLLHGRLRCGCLDWVKSGWTVSWWRFAVTVAKTRRLYVSYWRGNVPSSGRLISQTGLDRYLVRTTCEVSGKPRLADHVNLGWAEIWGWDSVGDTSEVVVWGGRLRW